MRPKEVQIPNLVNMTKEAAEAKAKGLKLVFEVKNEVYNTEVEAGKVISQEPSYKENYTVLEESTIKVVVSKGEKTIKIPCKNANIWSNLRIRFSFSLSLLRDLTSSPR